MRNTLTKWSGASVTLFQNGGSPDIYGKAISIQPGTETKIGISKTKMKTKYFKEPYLSKCTDNWQTKYWLDFQPYTTIQCREAAVQVTVMKHCKCVMHEKMLNGIVEMDPTNQLQQKQNH